MPERLGATVAKSAVVFTVVSSVSRSTAMPMPTASPTSSPRAMSSFLLGETGTPGTSACLTVVTLMGDGPPLVGSSSEATTVEKDVPTAFAIRAADCGSVSVTVTLI